MIAIVNYNREDAYVTSKGHEIKDVHFLATQRGTVHLPKNDQGWKVLSCHSREAYMTQAEFDRLVKRTPPHLKEDLEERVA